MSEGSLWRSERDKFVAMQTWEGFGCADINKSTILDLDAHRLRFVIYNAYSVCINIYKNILNFF